MPQITLTILRNISVIIFGYRTRTSITLRKVNREATFPLALTIVAVVFLLGGVLSLIETITSLKFGHISINFGVIGIFIGVGLFRLRRGWRTCALVFIWIGLVGLPIVGFQFLHYSGPLNFGIYGRELGSFTKEIGLAVIMISFLFTLWQFRVLTRPDVRSLFLQD